MADSRYRGLSLFGPGGKKVAEFHGVKYQIISNSVNVYADVAGGLAGFTDGALECAITATGMSPVAGMTFNFETQLVAQANVDLGVGLVNGKIHQTRGRCIRSEFDGDQKAGSTEAQYEFRAFLPKITG